MTALLIILGIIVYLIVGRTVINIFNEYELTYTDVDNVGLLTGISVLFFPIVIIWIIIGKTSTAISNAIINFVQNRKKLTLKK
jgi:hypothetical protein